MPLVVEEHVKLDVSFTWSVGVNDLVLAYLKTRLYWRQVLGVDTMVHHEQMPCEFVKSDAQVPALFSDALDWLGSKRLLALNWDLLLYLSIDLDNDSSRFDILFDTEIYELDICVVGVFVYDPEG